MVGQRSNFRKDSPRAPGASDKGWSAPEGARQKICCPCGPWFGVRASAGACIRIEKLAGPGPLQDVHFWGCPHVSAPQVVHEAAQLAWARLDANSDGQLDLEELGSVTQKSWTGKKKRH